MRRNIKKIIAMFIFLFMSLIMFASASPSGEIEGITENEPGITVDENTEERTEVADEENIEENINLGALGAGAGVNNPVVNPAENPVENPDWKWTISFDTDGGSSVANLTVDHNQRATTPTNPTKVGYSFVGWFLGEELFNFNAIITQNYSLKAVWAPNTDTAYKVNHYLENIEDAEYTLLATDEKTGTTGENTESEARTLAGFTALAITEKPINADGSTVVDIYYARNKYTLTYKITGDIDADDEYHVETAVKFETNLSELAKPKKPGYAFIGWTGFVSTMPAADLEITGYFELDEDNQEDWINLSFVAGENGSLEGTLNFRVLKAYPINSDEQVYKVIIPTPKANDGYAFDKWDNEIDLNATLTEDTTFVALFKDILPPAIENLKVVRDITNDDEIKVFGKIYDANIKNYNLRIVDQDKKLVSPWKGITVPENRDGELGVFDISDLAEGNYFVRVWANDTYGNSTGHNPHIYLPFTIDRTAPTITVKPAPASIGSIEEVIFSKVSFKLYDKYKIDYVVLNGVKKDLTNNQWSDLNDVRPGIYGAVEGENELVLYDVAGNKTSYKFILDTKAPTITVKPAPASIGSIEEVIFSKVSFKLYDKYKIDYVVLNGVKKDLTNNQWSDLNDVRPGIYGAVEGENELVLYDVAGNKTSYKFILDTKAPTITVKPAPASIGSIEEVIFSKVSFKLYDKYKIDYVVLNGVKKDLTNNQWSDLNDVRPGIYGAVEGENELVLYDVAGNKTSYKFILDTKAPTITVKPAPASIGSIEEVIFSKVSFKLYDKYKIDYVVLNGVKKDLTNNQWSDLNDVRPGIYGAVEGENELVLYDVAGNKTSYKFILDTKAPTITVKPAPASIGSIEEVIFSKVSFKLYDKYKIDYVVLNGVKKDLTNNQWSDLNDVRPGIYGAVEGENELVLYDVAGNKTSYKFILDTKAPTITVKPAPASIGSIEEVIFSKVSFKLYDKYKIDYVVLNGVKKDLTNNQWSDLNDVRPGIYGAVEGENELVLYDVAGNKTSYKFVLTKPSEFPAMGSNPVVLIGKFVPIDNGIENNNNVSLQEIVEEKEIVVETKEETDEEEIIEELPLTEEFILEETNTEEVEFEAEVSE